MGLLERIASEHTVQGQDADERRRLSEALFKRLDVRTIALVSEQSRERAYHEVEAALRFELEDPEFSDIPVSKRESLVRQVADGVLGYGPLERLLEDPEVSEVMVNGPKSVFYEKGGVLYPSTVVFEDEDQVRMIIERIVAPLGRRVDEQTPMVSARLPEGHRVNVVIPPVSPDGPHITIRKFRSHVFTLEELVKMGSLDESIAQMLRWAVRMRKNIAVSGGTGGGKTTLLNALSTLIDSRERIITIEDSAELKFETHPHVVRLEARMKNIEGQGEITIRDLVTNSLRMRPDRIVVGECRGAEAIDMLQAMNTGHDGSLTTLHANSPAEVITRLVMMARFGIELPVPVIEEQVASALDLIVQQDRFPDGTRRITQVVEVVSRNRRPDLRPLVTWMRHENRYVWSEEPTWIEEVPFMRAGEEGEVQRWRSGISS